jgi:hypothetical protein
VARLARLAQNNFADKTIDVWINNAGVISLSIWPFAGPVLRFCLASSA